MLVFLATASYAEIKLGSVLINDSEAAISTLYNEGKGAVQTVYNDGKSAVSELYPDVKSAIVSIAEGIGVAAEHVYTVSVKSFVVKGIKELIITIFALFIFGFGLYQFYKYVNNTKVINWKIIFPLLLCILGLFVGFKVNYDDLLMGLINPHFGAINYILEYAKDFV
jgi:hypothetical protein